MTDVCTCPPANNIPCDDFVGVITAQPQCQIVPDGSKKSNPYYDDINNITYYSYQFLINCPNDNSKINPGNLISFGIIICDSIPLDSVLEVSQLLDGAAEFIGVSFDFNEVQIPESGFRFLRVRVNEDVIPGSAGIYRIALSGNYPAVIPPGAGNKLTITTTETMGNINNVPYTFAGCPQVPRLTLTKTCESVISDNKLSLNFRVVVANTGDIDLPDVTFTDILNYDGNNVTFGPISVVPSIINVNSIIPGIVLFTGELGLLPRGDALEVLYTIPIQSFAEPDQYTFLNMATARTGVTEGVAQCEVSVDVVDLATDNCCVIENNSDVTFKSSVTNLPNSPSTAIRFKDILTIPNNIIVRFESFGNCNATLPSGEEVPINTDVTNTQITITCEARISQNATVQFPISFSVVEISSFTEDEYSISNRIDSVLLQEPDRQILIGVSPLPNTAEINVNTVLRCKDQ